MDLKNNQKLLKVEDNMEGLGGDEDRISKLPDCLLHHILSFLTTEEAFVTSILSTRWMYLFNSIPSLSFGQLRSCNSQDEANRFMNFVDRMLIFRDMSKIHKFHICCYKQCDKSRVNAWITTAIRRKVEDLHLSIHLKRSFVIPCSLFTCQSLTKLSLFMNSFINIPTFISFPRLKVLLLSFIQFSDEYLTQQLFSNCPVLEKLTLSFCRWLNMKKVCISAPVLKCLIMEGTEDVTGDGIHKCVVHIYAPKLVSFVYNCRMAKDFDLSILPSLVTAEIDCILEDSYGRQRKKEISHGAIKLLEGLSNVQFLIISGETLEALSLAGDPLVNLPLKFYNLIQLDVSAGYNYSIKNALRYLLQISPNLESLVFDEGLREFFENDLEWLSNEVPQCFLSHLKAIKVGKFGGSEREINVVQLFMKFARVLEKLTIIFASSLSSFPRHKLKFMEQLLMLPRASTCCAIDFS